jgi:hypothetical protein
MKLMQIFCGLVLKILHINGAKQVKNVPYHSLECCLACLDCQPLV